MKLTELLIVAFLGTMLGVASTLGISEWSDSRQCSEKGGAYIHGHCVDLPILK